MRKLIALFLIIALYPAVIFAQTGKLKGTVSDSTGNPVEAATIFIQGTKAGATADAHGNYVVENIAPGNYSVVVTMVGYNRTLAQTVIKANETTVLNFTIKAQVNMLKELTVMGTPSVNGMGHLREAQDGIIYSGKKTEVLMMDSMDANTAQNNPREVLGRIPGSNYSETEGGGFPSNGIALRGLRPTQSIEMQTRQDGYNIAADLYGYPETYYMPPLEALDRIEVIRGESSLQWGPQFGGVINYIIKDAPTDKPFQVTVQLTGGSYAFFDAYISMGGTYKKFSYFVYAQPKYSHGFRPNGDVTQISAFARIEYRFNKKFKLGAEYTLFRNRIHMAGGLNDVEFDQNPDQSIRARNWLSSPWNIGALTGVWNISDRSMLTFKSALNVSERNLCWFNPETGILSPDTILAATNAYPPREIEHEGFTSVTTEVRFLTHYNILGYEQTLAAGIRYFQGYMNREEGGIGSTGSDFDMTLYSPYTTNLDFTTFNIAPFIENTFHIGKIVSITPGFRFEYIESTSKGTAIDPNTSSPDQVHLRQYWEIPLGGCGLQIKTTPTTNVYANFSQCYEPTNYSNLTPLGTTSIVDPNLKDVSGFNSDLGWRGSIGNTLNFDVGGFYMPFNKEIGLESLANAAGTASYTYVTNVGNALHVGAETYVEVNPFKNSSRYRGWGRISVFNSYSFDHSYYTSGPFKGNVEEMAPLNIERAGLSYAYKIFSTTFLFSYASKSFADANNTVYSPDATVGLIPAYFVMDWSSSFHIKKYNIKLGISNVTNTKYFNLRTDEYPGPGIIPAPPRSFYLGFGAQF